MYLMSEGIHKSAGCWMPAPCARSGPVTPWLHARNALMPKPYALAESSPLAANESNVPQCDNEAAPTNMIMKSPVFSNFLLVLAFAISMICVSTGGRAHAAAPRLSVAANSMDAGWRLLLDRAAEWRGDTLYLPDEVDLAKLPTNPPTGGWAMLNQTAGLAVSLPDTVEAHEFIPATGDAHAIINARPTYEGVSWWFRPFTAPVLKSGERLVFSFRGARLRSEVYVNGQLCGYNLITEAPFSADVTKALHAGQNQLAVRITNPGGNIDWVDFTTFSWGKYQLPISHAFGGMDGGVQMEVRDPVSVSDLTVLNTPDLKTVTVQAEVDSSGPAFNGPLALTIRKGDKVVWSGAASVKVPARGKTTLSRSVTVAGALPWNVNRPELYTASASLTGAVHSGKSTIFGFRWLSVKGLGTNAFLTFNGRRIVPRSSISWGFWAPNGMFPDQAAANREVAAMRAIGLDSIQNHRHMPKPIVLDTFDREGLLRYCEPGAGLYCFENGPVDAPSPRGPVETSGAGGEATTFTERYERAKVLAMIRENRSHPCVSMWTLQNEIEPDLNNPKIWNILRQMRAADPSRLILLKSGVNTRNQVWSLPYSSEWMFDKGDGASGWWDQHTALSNTGVYRDEMYSSPTEWQYRSDNAKEIVVWGEMATGASPDNHQADLDWYSKNTKTGYDRAAHQALLDSYNGFLDEFKFRAAFPTAELLFREAGNKHYFSAARVVENARMSDAVDYIVLSGWESTAVEDHSGLVDSLRLLKGDPSPIKRASAPELLVVRPRQYVVANHALATVDVHLINETGRKGAFRLSLSAAMSSADAKNKPFFQTTVRVSVIGGNVFGQLLTQNIQFAPPAAGSVTITTTLKALNSETPLLSRTEQLQCVDTNPAPLTGTLAFAGVSQAVGKAIKTQFGAEVIPFAASNPRLKTLLLASDTDGVGFNWKPFGDATVPIEKTDDPGLFQQQLYGAPTTIRTFGGLANGLAKVELFFAESYFNEPGKRVFDVALNGQTVLRDFDIMKESGGKDRALIKTFEAPVGNRILELSVPRVARDFASIAAVRVTDSAGVVTRSVFREGLYTDKAGAVWQPINEGAKQVFDWNAVLPSALTRVHDEGTRLVLLTSGGDDARAVAELLDKANIARFDGMSGEAGASWLGFWYFGRKHPLLEGLPSNCVLDWPYQIATGNGMFLHGVNVEAVIGYGKNHDPRLSLGAATISYGKGQIVLLGLPGLTKAFAGNDASGFQPVTAKRLIYNALK